MRLDKLDALISKEDIRYGAMLGEHKAKMAETENTCLYRRGDDKNKMLNYTIVPRVQARLGIAIAVDFVHRPSAALESCSTASRSLIGTQVVVLQEQTRVTPYPFPPCSFTPLSLRSFSRITLLLPDK